MPNKNNAPVEVHPSGRRGTKRLIREGKAVGTLVQTEDKRWRLYDADRYLLTTETYGDANQARDAFVQLEGGPPASPDRLPEPIEMETTGFGDARRLVRGNEIVGMLLQLTNGRWGVYDTNERPLLKGRYASPAKARDAFIAHSQADKAADETAHTN